MTEQEEEIKAAVQKRLPRATTASLERTSFALRSKNFVPKDENEAADSFDNLLLSAIVTISSSSGESPTSVEAEQRQSKQDDAGTAVQTRPP